MMGFQLSRSQTVHVRNTVIHGLRWVRGEKKKDVILGTVYSAGLPKLQNTHYCCRLPESWDARTRSWEAATRADTKGLPETTFFWWGGVPWLVFHSPLNPLALPGVKRCNQGEGEALGLLCFRNAKFFLFMLAALSQSREVVCCNGAPGELPPSTSQVPTVP